MPSLFATTGSAIATFLVFAMIIAGITRILKTKESPKLIRDGANALSALFRGVLK